MDPMASCPCLTQCTRFHKSLCFAATELVRVARPFVEFTIAAHDQIERYVARLAQRSATTTIE